MKIFAQSIVLLSMFSSLTSFAATLNYAASTANDAASGLPINASATETVTGQSKVLSLVGEGVRMDKVVGFNKQAYLAQLFAETPAAIQRDPKTVTGSLTAAGMKALKLTVILQLIPLKIIVSKFTNALDLNIVGDADEAAYGASRDAFLDAVRKGGGLSKGKEITLLGYVKADGTEELIYEDSNGNANTIDSKSPGFVNKIFGIWLGNIDPSDQGLLDLETSLLTAPKL